MKHTIRLFVLLLLSKIAVAQEGLNHAVKLNFEINKYNPTIKLDTNYNYGPDINHTIRNFKYYPSIMYKTKKKNWREIQVGGFLKNFDSYRKNIPAPFDTLTFLGYKQKKLNLFINSITHIDLLKKRNTKLKLFFSSNAKLEYENQMYDPYNKNLSYYSKSKIISLNLGLSTRIGYNLTQRFYVEIEPFLKMETTLYIGTRFVDNPLIPTNLKNQPIFDLDNLISIPSLANFLNFSVAYRF